MSEKIGVFIQFGEDGTIECLCKQGRKRCDNWCEKAVVFYDRYRGWRSTYNYSKYGRSIESDEEREGGRRYEPQRDD
jgi:hypothetical protein